jgi:uncharacterized iron-regulated membrane protein
LLRLLHNQLGILIAPFIFIASLTGLLYGLTPQLENFIYKEQLIAKHIPTQKILPLSQQVSAALTILPTNAKIFAVRTPITPEHTTRILYQLPHQSNITKAIFINPYTLDVQGQLPVYGTSGVLPLRTFLDELHRSLLFGEYGRAYSEFAASWLGIFALTGLIQWWNYRKKNKNNHPRHLNIKWHYIFGLAVLPMLFFFSITGLTWSKWTGANIAELRHLLNSDTPSLNLALTSTTLNAINPHAEHHMHIDMSDQRVSNTLNLKDFDHILTIAYQNGLSAQALQIKPSYRTDRAWSIEEMGHRWPIQIDALAVDMQNYDIVDHLRFNDFPLSAKLTRWGVDLHIGVLFGLVNQLILVFSAGMILLLLVFSYRAWWTYQRPLHTLRRFNQELWCEWKTCTCFQKITYISIFIGLYFLVPVWAISVILLQLTVILIHYLGSKKRHES